MATPVKMPQMGESVVEGTIIKWLKSEGDSVETDEALCEVSTDKVDTEIPSPIAGTLTKILVQEGDTVEVGTALCEIDEGGEGAAKGDEEPAAEEEAPGAPAPQAEEERAEEPKPAKAEAEEAPPEKAETEAVPAQPAPSDQAPPAPPAEERRRAPAERPAAAREREGPPTRTGERRPGQLLSPLVRRLAREHDIDLSTVRGTGPGGRITKDDVLDVAEGRRAPAAPATRETEEGPERPAPPEVREAAGQREETQQLSHIRRRIAEHMLHSLQTSARAWNVIEVDMENIARLRASVNPEFRRREGYSLTYMPFIARACVDALLAFPVVNASISEDLTEAVYHHYVNLGIAVATDYGLIVPVVKGAESLNVVGLARGIRDLAERARAKKLAPDDVGGSTFSITNPGPFGSYMSVPVINQPNVAILSTEAVEQRVVAVDGMIGLRHRMFLSMSWDHRLLDGADAMRFLARLKENLEGWDFSHEVTQS